MHFNAQAARIVAPGNAPVTGHVGIQLDGIAVLPRLDMQILFELVPLVKHVKFDLLAVRRGDHTYGAVVGVDANLRATGYAEGLGKVLLRACRWCKSRCRQKGRGKQESKINTARSGDPGPRNQVHEWNPP